MGKYFLSKIQIFHDKPSNWNYSGISHRGKEHAIEICDEFNLKEETKKKILNNA